MLSKTDAITIALSVFSENYSSNFRGDISNKYRVVFDKTFVCFRIIWSENNYEYNVALFLGADAPEVTVTETITSRKSFTLSK